MADQPELVRNRVIEVGNGAGPVRNAAIEAPNQPRLVPNVLHLVRNGAIEVRNEPHRVRNEVIDVPRQQIEVPNEVDEVRNEAGAAADLGHGVTVWLRKAMKDSF